MDNLHKCVVLPVKCVSIVVLMRALLVINCLAGCGKAAGLFVLGFGGRSLLSAALEWCLAVDSFTCAFSVLDLSFECWCGETARQQSRARGPAVKMDFILNGKTLSDNLTLKFPEWWHITCSTFSLSLFFFVIFKLF